MKKLVAALVAALALALPAAAGAVILDPGGGGGGPACAYGLMNGDGVYYGTIPYYGSNSLVELQTTITNINWVGFVGSADVYTYSSSYVSANMWLLPSGSATIYGPTYTTPWNNTSGVPFHIDLGAQSDAVLLEYQVCV